VSTKRSSQRLQVDVQLVTVAGQRLGVKSGAALPRTLTLNPNFIAVSLARTECTTFLAHRHLGQSDSQPAAAMCKRLGAEAGAALLAVLRQEVGVIEAFTSALLQDAAFTGPPENHTPPFCWWTGPSGPPPPPPPRRCVSLWANIQALPVYCAQSHHHNMDVLSALCRAGFLPGDCTADPVLTLNSYKGSGCYR